MKSFVKKPIKVLGTIAQSSHSRLFAVIGTCLIVATTLFLKNQMATIKDQIPTIEQLTAKEKNRATSVTMGLHINGFPSFSFVKNEFTLDGIVWFKFQPGTVSLKTISDFSIQNSLVQGSGALTTKSEPIVKLLGNDVQVSYHIQTTFKTDLNFSNFPLENHRLTIVIQNKNVTPYELCFEATNRTLTIAEKNLVLDWEPKATLVQTGYMQADLETDNPAAAIRYPVAAFSIDFEGVGIRDLISLYFPMFLLFFLAFFCLLIDISDISRLAYIATAIPILVLFRMVIDGVSPAIGYSTHIDFVFYLLTFLSLLLLFFQTYVVLAIQTIKLLPEHLQGLRKAKLIKLNDLMFMFTLIFLVAAMIYSLFR